MLTNKKGEGYSSGSFRVDRDRGTWLAGGVLIAIAVFAWVAVVLQAMEMSSMSSAKSEMAMGSTTAAISIPLAEIMAFLGAWGIMMTAMMLPSATPMIVLYSGIRRNFSQTGHKGIPTTLFTLVYLAVWLVFGIPVYAASLVVEVVANAYPAVAGLLPYALALVLLGAGAYQLSSWKQVCLRACQSPLGFLMGHWRSGYRGTLRMALEHAAYCIGCCWGLMVVLVAAGAMALHWVLLIAVLVFAEKVLPYGEWTGRIAGGVLLVLGLLVVAQPDLAAVLRGSAM